MAIDRKHASFMRSLCLGVIEEEIVLPYPEPTEAEAETIRAVIATLESMLGPREKDFAAWDRAGETPKEFLEELRQAGLFGLVIPEEHGGMGFGATAYSRVLQGITRHDGSVRQNAAIISPVASFG